MQLENGSSSVNTEKPETLFNSNVSPKLTFHTTESTLGHSNLVLGHFLSSPCKFPVKIVKSYRQHKKLSKRENKNCSEISWQNGTTWNHIEVKEIKFSQYESPYCPEGSPPPLLPWMSICNIYTALLQTNPTNRFLSDNSKENAMDDTFSHSLLGPLAPLHVFKHCRCNLKTNPTNPRSIDGFQ